MKRLQDSLSELEICTSVDQACSWMSGFAADRDLFFGYLGSGHAKDYAAAVKVTNYPDAWIFEYCAEKLYEADPLRLTSLHNDLPFRWDQVGNRTPERREPIDAPKMLDMARRHGMKSGIAIPIVMPREQRAMMCFAATTAGGGFDRLVEAHAGALYLAALHFHAFVRKLDTNRLAPLTPRERSCLSLAAQGLSNKQIAIALGLSARTTKFHTDNARKKVGAANMIQAITIARDLGIV